MKKISKLIALLLAAFMVCGLLAGCSGSGSADNATSTPTEASQATEESKAEETPAATEESKAEETPAATEESTPAETTGDVTDLPRNETLYFGGLQWGTVNAWNPIGANQNNFAIAGSPQGSRTVMFETLYMYDFLSGKLYPLLADGDYTWNDDMTELTFKIKEAAKWSDGTPVTAADVAKTFEASVAIGNGTGTTYGAYIDSIEADGLTGVIKLAKTEEGGPKNPLLAIDYLTGVYVAQAAWIDTMMARNNNDPVACLNDKAEDVPYSGPYGRLYDDDQKLVLVRNDNYWGQDASMWGSLPVPKYLAHAMYADNAATETAFKAGQIDVNQQFLPNIQNLWLNDGLPISTFYDEEPYGVCLTMPTAWYNMNIPVLKENPALRKAIAMAVDYPSIIANAMTNQSPSFEDVPRSLMNPTEGEQALYDHDAVKDLQWAGNDIEGAKALLDEAGIVDTDGDGYREWNGEKISLNACCPNGWSDWQAAMEIVAAAGENIGIEITTLYPEWSIYQTVFTMHDQTEYQIFMYSPAAASPSNPWMRCMMFMSSSFVGIDNNWSGNWGQYVNEEADEILNKIPTISDEAELKAAYTRLTEIYLTEVPSFSLMYRPAAFDAVNETVWTNFPSADDGRNITPYNCVSGYAIRALYELELVD